MMKSPKASRTRRSPNEAKELFLACAETLLAEGGIAAVQMRAVARRCGVTDAAIAYHFRDRQGLINALMKHVLNKVRKAVYAIVESWVRTDSNISTLIEQLDRLYSQGYAELAIAASNLGWRDDGTPILKPVADVLINKNKNPTTTDNDIRRILACVHMDLAMSPLYGAAFRRSVGLGATSHRKQQLAWWSETIEQLLVSTEVSNLRNASS